jgi:hypothetical protein
MTAGVPVFLMFATSAANLLVFGPATTKVMKERKHQGMMGKQVATARHGEGYKLTLPQKQETARNTMTQARRALK